MNRVFPGFSPGRYVSGTSPVRHDITRSPTFCVLSTFSNRFFRVLTGFFSGLFPGFNRVLTGFFKKPGKNLVQFSPTPSMADPLQRSTIIGVLKPRCRLGFGCGFGVQIFRLGARILVRSLARVLQNRTYFQPASKPRKVVEGV